MTPCSNYRPQGNILKAASSCALLERRRWRVRERPINKQRKTEIEKRERVGGERAEHERDR